MKSGVKKIVIVFNTLNIGGIETKIVDLCHYYSHQKNIRLYLLLKSKSGPLLQSIPKNIIINSPPITNFFKIKSWLFPFWLCFTLKAIQPRLILAFGNYSAICAVIGKYLGQVNANLIISEDSSIVEQLKSDTFSFFRKILVKTTYPTVTKIIVLTKIGQDKLDQLIPHQKNKTVILNNWLPLSFPTKQLTKNKDIDLLFLGRFEPQKNPIKFLEISQTLIKINSRLKIAMVGYGSLGPKIRNYISKNNLRTNISVFPKTTKSWEYFQRSKILLLTSDHEGFPLTILESTASACLPVCQNLNEVKDYFDLQPTLILYRNQDEAVKKIKYLLSHSQKTEQLSKYYQQKTIANQNNNFQKTINFINKYL